MKSYRALISTALACAAFCVASPAAHAQGSPPFPTRLVTLVVPFTPSSGSDIVARIMAPRLSSRWHQPVIIDNRPGASGNLGAGFVALAPPDGHTLLMMTNTYTMTPALYKNMPFDPVADLTPVSELAQTSFAFAVTQSLPVTDIKGLAALAKQSPGKFNYATPGNGTPHHLAMELLKANLGLDIVHVPYKGLAGATSDLMGGQVQMMFGATQSLISPVQGGKVRLLAVTGSERSQQVPDVPTFREQGIDVMDGVDVWFGVMAPARTPTSLVARINADFIDVLNSSEVRAELTKAGLSIKTGTPEQLGALIKSDIKRWSGVVKAAGISAD